MPLATNIALILAATAAAASKAPVGAIPPEPEDWSHLLGRLRRQKNRRVMILEK